MRAMPELRSARINGDMHAPRFSSSAVRPGCPTRVTVSSISETIRIATLGDLDQNSAKFSLSDGKCPFA